MKLKKRLTHDQEFDILKLVLDKILWLGFAIMAYGMYNMWTSTVMEGISWMVVGAVILIIFMVIIIREYEFIVR